MEFVTTVRFRTRRAYVRLGIDEVTVDAFELHKSSRPAVCPHSCELQGVVNPASVNKLPSSRSQGAHVERASREVDGVLNHANVKTSE